MFLFGSPHKPAQRIQTSSACSLKPERSRKVRIFMPHTNALHAVQVKYVMSTFACCHIQYAVAEKIHSALQDLTQNGIKNCICSCLACDVCFLLLFRFTAFLLYFLDFSLFLQCCYVNFFPNSYIRKCYNNHNYC